MRAAVEERHPLDVEYEQIAIINFVALSGNDDPECREYQELLALIPNGVYRRYDGQEYLLLGIERHFSRGLRREFYVAQTIPLTGSLKESCSVIVSWRLIGNQDCWFNPAWNGSKRVARFRLIRRLDIIRTVKALRCRTKKKIRK